MRLDRRRKLGRVVAAAAVLGVLTVGPLAPLMYAEGAACGALVGQGSGDQHDHDFSAMRARVVQSFRSACRPNCKYKLLYINI